MEGNSTPASLNLQRIGGYILAATAVVACPCHLLFVLPLVLGIIGGTALGNMLSSHPEFAFAGATAYFLLAAGGAYWLLSGRAQAGSSSQTPSAAPERETLSCCPSAVKGARHSYD